MSTTTADIIQPSFPTRLYRSLTRRFSQFLDQCVPHYIARWLFLVCLLGAYFYRVHIIQGFYIITYGLGIYLLNMFIGFLTPRDDVSSYNDGPTLPTDQNEEFKPFIRRLPEFQFWKGATRATMIAMTCTFLRC
eukprot:UN23990